MSRGGEQVELPELTTGPTDQGARPMLRAAPRPALDSDLEDMATDEVPVLLRLAPALPPPAPSPDSLPPLRFRPEELVAAAVAPELTPASISDEQSTGLFESWTWDEADPYSTGEYPSVPIDLVDVPVGPAHDPYLSRASRAPAPRDAGWEREMTGPRLAVVQQAPVDEDYGGVRAAPMPVPPRPAPGEPGHDPAAAGGPLRAFRPAPCEVPSDWLDDDQRHDTLIVIDPTLRAPGRPWVAVALLDAGAWTLGFAMTFLTGVVTTASASLVMFALSTL